MARWSIPLMCLVVGGAAGSFVAAPILRGQDAQKNPNVPKEITSYRDVVKTVLPAVVSIESRIKLKARGERQPRTQPRIPDGVPEDMRKFFENMPQDMEQLPVHGFGSGFIIDPKGTVLTNYHVIDGADQVEIQLTDGRKFLSKEIKGDRKTDLAIVRFDAKGALPFLELGNSDAMEIGDRVLAVGAPFGLTGSVTHGIVSAKGRNRMGVNDYEDFIQTDAAINRGNSGGPLVSLDGKVIGINTAIKSENGGSQGVGLAIASSLAKSIVKALQTEGVVRRGYLGVEMRDLTPEVADKLELKDAAGVVVGRVVNGSPAEKAGLQPLDVVTQLSGKPIKDGRELQQAVVGLPLNKPVELTVIREGKTIMVPITIEEQPQNFTTLARMPRTRRSAPEEAETLSIANLGITVKDLTPEVGQKLGYKESASGVLIAGVTPNGPASEAGLQANMLVVRVDKTPVKSAADFQDKLDKASLQDGVLLQVQTVDGTMSYVVVKAE